MDLVDNYLSARIDKYLNTVSACSSDGIVRYASLIMVGSELSSIEMCKSARIDAAHIVWAP